MGQYSRLNLLGFRSSLHCLGPITQWELFCFWALKTSPLHISNQIHKGKKKKAYVSNFNTLKT